jgi:glutamine synthetase
MSKVKLEYVWLDGYKPEPNFRSKTKVLNLNNYNGDVEVLPIWSFDGSSTQQAEGKKSDCLLKPVRTYKDPARLNAWLVLCEVLNADGTVHESNYRSKVQDVEDLWLGFEQEYVLMNNNLPLGFPANGYPEPQGKYYCAVGNGNVAGREIVEEHLDLCLEAGLDVTGINAEVLLGQWEFQLFGKGSLKACDDLMMCRYLLYRLSEKHNITIELHPKPVKGDWNGSGMHTNFSTQLMREVGGKEMMDSICTAFGKYHAEHIAEYGSSNEQRLTGLHETQSIHKFSFGVSDRGSSIRIPVSVPLNEWKGYLEDRRPSSNADPYRVTAVLQHTISEAMKQLDRVAVS